MLPYSNFCSCLAFNHQPSCPTSLVRLLLLRISPRSDGSRRDRYYWDSDSCQCSPHRQVSPLTSCHLPVVPSSTTWYTTSPLWPPLQRDAFFPGFAESSQARRHTPPKQVRHPTDQQFASGYSPPRLATPQLPSATKLWPTSTGTCTLQMARHHGRTLNRSAVVGPHRG